MCKFARDHWVCGHWKRTRIEYCHVVSIVRLNERRKMPCLVLDDTPGLNNDFNTRCENCISLRLAPREPPCWKELPRWPAPALQLVYDCLSKGSDLQQERTNARDDIIRIRQDVSNALTIVLRTGRELLDMLSRTLFLLEDRYRYIAGRYYRTGWFARLDPMLPEEYREVLRDALEDNIPLERRNFFMRIGDPKAMIDSALECIEDRRIAIQTRIRLADAHYKSIRKVLKNLDTELGTIEHHVKLSEQIQDVNVRFGIVVQQPYEERNVAFWYWLQSVPEFQRELAAGKNHIRARTDALYFGRELDGHAERAHVMSGPGSRRSSAASCLGEIEPSYLDLDGQQEQNMVNWEEVYELPA